MADEYLQRYGAHSLNKAIFKEPYAKATSEFMAQLLRYLNPANAHILVIGGGTGIFSRVVLPKIRSLLRESGTKIKIECVESDRDMRIRRAPGFKALADMHRLPFKEGVFDLVVSESAIHQPSIGGIGERLKEVNRVMKPKSIFVNFQDIGVPIAYAALTVPPERLGKNVITVGASLDNLHFILNAFARQKRMSYALMELREEMLVKRRRIVKKYHGTDLNWANYLLLDKGLILADKRKEIPRGRRKYEYRSVANMLAKGIPLSPFGKLVG